MIKRSIKIHEEHFEPPPVGIKIPESHGMDIMGALMQEANKPENSGMKVFDYQTRSEEREIGDTYYQFRNPQIEPIICGSSDYDFKKSSKVITTYLDVYFQ